MKNYKLQIHDQEQPKNGNFVLFRIVPYLDISNFFGGAFRALCLCTLRGVAVLHVTFFVELLDVAEGALVVVGDEVDGDALAAEPAASTDPVERDEY